MPKHPMIFTAPENISRLHENKRRVLSSSAERTRSAQLTLTAAKELIERTAKTIRNSRALAKKTE